MKSLIRKCPPRCGAYTMRENCPQCGGLTMMALPPRYSEKDRFQRYRLRELVSDGAEQDRN